MKSYFWLWKACFHVTVKTRGPEGGRVDSPLMRTLFKTLSHQTPQHSTLPDPGGVSKTKATVSSDFLRRSWCLRYSSASHLWPGSYELVCKQPGYAVLTFRHWGPSRAILSFLSVAVDASKLGTANTPLLGLRYMLVGGSVSLFCYVLFFNTGDWTRASCMPGTGCTTESRLNSVGDFWNCGAQIFQAHVLRETRTVPLNLT